MGRRLLLDTGVIIAIERGRLDPAAVFQPDDSVALSVFSTVELRVGLFLAKPEYQPRLAAFLDGVFEVVETLLYDQEVSRHHTRLLAWAAANGRTKSAMDLLIAATAAATGRTLVTTDKKAQFGELPGVEAELVAV
ncbi:MAG: PIN domain-containing protein [Propionibacteriaceae bacterium]|nr:PIN domain-containing protein [Propionibacteriaceae bacterium]